MFLTKEQISFLYKRTDKYTTSRILKNFFKSYCSLLNSSDVKSIYDKQYFEILNNHPIYKIINNEYKINIYTKYIYDYLTNKNINNSKILDIGCGNGDLILSLAQKNIKFGLGIDYSNSAIDICKEKLKKSNLKNCKFICDDISNYKEIEKFDYVVLSDITEHLSDSELDNLFTNLKKFIDHNSEIIIHTPNGMALCNNTDTDIFQKIILFLKKLKGWKGYYWSIDELYYSQAHINVKSHRQLRFFLNKHGFKSKVLYDEKIKYLGFLSYLLSSNMLVIAKLEKNRKI